MKIGSLVRNGLDAFARLTSSEIDYGGRGVRIPFPRQSSGIFLTHLEAMRLAAVWACVTVISKSLASSRWEVFQENGNGDRELKRNTTTYRLLNVRPNPEMGAFGYHEAMIILALIDGNSYAEIEFDTAGRPAALWPLANERCTLDRNARGERILRVINYGEADTELPYSSVYHLHGPGIDGFCGFDTVALAARSFAHAIATERFGQKFYENDAQIGGLLTSEKGLNKEQRQELREVIESGHAGVSKAFRFLILSGGLKWESLSVEQDKAQFIETRYLAIEDTCRWFGVPPHKIAHLLRSTFSNIEHQGLEFVRDALTPWAERCAQEADYKLLPNQGKFKVRIDTDWLAEGDAQSKATTDSILVRNGLRTRNEVRRRRGDNTIGALGDLLTVEANMTTLNQIATAPAQQPTQRQIPEQQPTLPAGPQEAARALYASAMKRVLIRYTRKLEALAESPRAHREQTIMERVEQIHSGHEQYAHNQILEVHEVLLSTGLDPNTFAVQSRLNEFMREDFRMAAEAAERRNLSDWCLDVEQRAEMIAIQLAEAASFNLQTQ